MPWRDTQPFVDGTNSSILPCSETVMRVRADTLAPPKVVGLRCATVLSTRTYDSGTSHPRPAAPNPLPVYVMPSGTGSPPRDGGRSSGTDAAYAPAALGPSGAKPVSEERPAYCAPVGATCARHGRGASHTDIPTTTSEIEQSLWDVMRPPRCIACRGPQQAPHHHRNPRRCGCGRALGRSD